MSPGAVIANRFRLERELGSGGMGAVWAATHLVTNKSVALKFLHEKHVNADARRRVLREARAACAVQHPNVVSVHDVIEDETGTPVLVMDLLRGESLADKLARERTLSPAETVAMVTPVLSALSAAHAAGVIHRDLKPDNVFLVDGVSSNVRILDFGVAKLSSKDGAAKETKRLTETGAMIGTPHYMAPEQAFGESDIDARADLWAVGAVVYECLSGVTPTDGQNLGQILKVLASGSIQPLAARVPAVPTALAAVVDGLLAIEKVARPASAALVLEQLAALTREPSALSTSTLTASLGPEAARAGTLLQASTPRPSRAPKRRVGRWVASIAGAVALASAAGVLGARLRAPTLQASATAEAPARTAGPSSPSPLASPAPGSGGVLPEPAARVVTSSDTPNASSAAPKPAARRAAPPSPASAATTKSTRGPLIADPTF